MLNKWQFKSLISLQNTYPVWQNGWYTSVNTNIYTWDFRKNRWIISNVDEFTNINNQIIHLQNEDVNINTRIDNITNLTTTTTDLLLDWTHHKIVCDATNNDITITLPTAVWINWKQYIITRIDDTDNTVIIQPQVWETLYWDTSQELFQYETLDFTSDNTNYN